MEKTVKRIIRSSDVELKGQIRLDTLSQAGSGNNANRPQNTDMMPASAKIVENNTEYAVIELTCSCGQKTQIKCQYAAQNG
ncbi:MAG: hypothetical protein WCZ89_06410 [Phycisphaerae bacterium]